MLGRRGFPSARSGRPRLHQPHWANEIGLALDCCKHRRLGPYPVRAICSRPAGHPLPALGPFGPTDGGPASRNRNEAPADGVQEWAGDGGAEPPRWGYAREAFVRPRRGPAAERYQSASTEPPENWVLMGVYWWTSNLLPSGSSSQICHVLSGMPSGASLRRAPPALGPAQQSAGRFDARPVP